MPTANSDIIKTSEIAILFDANPQTWVVAPTIIVFSTSNRAVESTLNNSKLVNHGHVFSTADSEAGVRFFGDHGVINNAVDGEIVAAHIGVEVKGSGHAINN